MGRNHVVSGSFRRRGGAEGAGSRGPGLATPLHRRNSASVLPRLPALSPSANKQDFCVNVLKEMYILHTWLKKPNSETNNKRKCRLFQKCVFLPPHLLPSKAGPCGLVWGQGLEVNRRIQMPRAPVPPACCA